MGDDKEQKGGNVSADSITGKVKGEILKSKRKGLEAKVKKVVEEIESAQEILSMKEQELVDLFEDNEALLD